MPAGRWLAACALVTFAVQAWAQPARGPAKAVRGFISVNVAAQAAPADLEDHILFEANAEEGAIDTRYPARTGVLTDAGAGVRMTGALGIALSAARTRTSGNAAVTARMPHPFFDSRHRIVEAGASGISRTETSVHAQLYYDLQPMGRWRVRLLAGPTYVRVQQDLVTDVQVDEAFPYDTVQFRAAPTGLATGSGIGFNGAVDISTGVWSRVDLGLLIRYSRTEVDLNASESRAVSTDAGGLQAGVGIRMLF